MAVIELKKEGKEIISGNDNIVIVKYIDGIVGGRTLTITDYKAVTGTAIVKAGHIIITKDGEYKPMAVIPEVVEEVPTGNIVYGTLPVGWAYAGVLVATINAENEGAGIMTRGKVNKSDNVQPYPLSSILSAVKTALPLIEFTEDNA